jgi:integrase
VRNALRAVDRERGTKQRHAAPLRLQDADRIVDRKHLRAEDDERELRPMELRDIALLRVRHAMLTRANELASITVESVRYQDDGTARVDLLRRKTSDSDEPTFLNVQATEALRAWLTAGGITSGHVFVRMSAAGKPDAKPLDRKTISGILKTMALGIGLDPATFSSHSMRRGAAQDLMGDGADIGAIAQAGGWKTTVMPLRYTKDLAAGDGAVAQFFRKRRR